MFTKHVVPGLDHFIVPQKESNYEVDITTKKVLNELDSSNV
jgi:hypothetical protein